MKINGATQIGDTGYPLANLKPYILYHNDNGSTGNLTINDAIENYKYYELIPATPETAAVKNKVGNKVVISRYECDGAYLYIGTGQVKITETSLVKSNTYTWYGPISSPYQNRSNGDWYPIYEVIGWK